MQEERRKGERRQRAPRADNIDGHTDERVARASGTAETQQGEERSPSTSDAGRFGADDLEVSIRERNEEAYGEVQ